MTITFVMKRSSELSTANGGELAAMKELTSWYTGINRLLARIREAAIKVVTSDYNDFFGGDEGVNASLVKDSACAAQGFDRRQTRRQVRN